MSETASPTPTPTPATPPPPPVPGAQPHVRARRVGKTRNPWGVWLLSLVTLGIYGLYWYYKVNQEAREYSPNVQVQPGIALIAYMFGGFTLGIATIVTIVKTGGRIAQCQRGTASSSRCSGGLGLLFAILLGTHLVYYQSQLNKVWDEHGNPEPGTVV